MQERILRWHIIGGLGDVSLTRKLKAYFSNADLREKFKVVTLVDIYPKEQVLNQDNFEKLFKLIKDKKIKGKVEPFVEQQLREGFRNGSIRYMALTPGTSRLPMDYLASLTSDDIVDVSSPNKFHADFAIQALKYSRAHITVEKPVVTSLAEAAMLRRAMKEANLEGRVAMDGDHYPNYPHIDYYIKNFEKYSVNSGRGYDFGKIRNVRLIIEEDEDFSSERNRDLIDIAKGGFGIWFDMGVHLMSVLRNCGAKMRGDSIVAYRHNFPDSHLKTASGKYAETGMHVDLTLEGGKCFENNCSVCMRVGKARPRTVKEFLMEYERGFVDIDVKGGTLRARRNGDLNYVEDRKFEGDAFYHLMNSIYNAIVNNIPPLTTLEKGIQNVEDVVRIKSVSKPSFLLADSYC